MNKVNKWIPLVCAIGWLALLIISVFTEDANYKLAFTISAAVNVIVFAAQFLVVHDNDR